MNKSLLTIAAVGGLAIGGLSATQVASAQGYGGDGDTPSVEVEEVDGSSVDSLPLLPIQDGTDADEDGDAENEDGERNGRRGRGCNLDAAATAIGIEVAELRTALDTGQSIADVASANGVDPDTVVSAMVAASEQRLAQKVESGRLTQAEADERLAERADRITDRVFGTAEAEAA